MAGLFYDRTVGLLSARPVLAGVLTASVVGVTWAFNDFLTWKSIGTGGTAPTIRGYLRMRTLSLSALLSPTDPLSTSNLSQTGPSYLAPLPLRPGAPPQMSPYIMPQRQLARPLPADISHRLDTIIPSLASSYPTILYTKPSHTEGNSTLGLYAHPSSINPQVNPIARDRILNHEIAHVHREEGSLHVWLADRDVREVLEKGWGQRFPLGFVRGGWTHVWAPREEGEVVVLEAIVRAGVGWVTGVDVSESE